MNETNITPVAKLWKPQKGRIAIKLPNVYGNRQMIRNWCGKGTTVTWDRGNKYWLVSRKHFKNVLGGLKHEYGTVLVVVDHSDIDLCTEACQDASWNTVNECVCICNGMFHGGGGGPWKNPVGQMLIAKNVYRTTFIENRAENTEQRAEK